ncbi:MAG: MFS transporter [Alphaproteobacteria bacterium]|nr:MFS transporter [Alphaproteobacteria bacterium]
MNRAPRLRMLAPFEVRSYRYQWPADLATSCAFEMETIALGWFILVETGSVLLLSLFASLQYLGTLLAPAFGLVGDRIGHRTLVCLMRTFYTVLAAVLGGLAFTNTLGPMEALVIAGLAGLVRPSDSGLRNVLISETMPSDRLLGAIGLSRITTDSARAGGALAGAGMIAILGIGGAYALIVILYAVSVVLTRQIGEGRSAPTASMIRASPWRELGEAIRLVWRLPAQLAALALAFLVNLAAYPFILGLLPFIARDIYAGDQHDLGWLIASSAIGAVIASILVSRLEHRILPGRVMFAAALVWHVFTLALAQTTSVAGGITVLLIAGTMQGLCLVPLAVLQLRNAPPELRGRIAGLRTLAVYGLPMGLWASGPMIERLGFATATTIFGTVGLVATVLMLALGWRHLWPADAPANRR